MHFPLYKERPPLLVPGCPMPALEEDGAHTSVFRQASVTSTVPVCPPTCCQRFQKIPREQKEPFLGVISESQVEPAGGRFPPSSGPSGHFFFLQPNTCGFYWLDCDWRQRGEREYRALKMTKHFHLREPSEKGGREHIFLREAISQALPADR